MQREIALPATISDPHREYQIHLTDGANEKPPEGLAPFLAANFIARLLLFPPTRWSNRVQG